MEKPLNARSTRAAAACSLLCAVALLAVSCSERRASPAAASSRPTHEAKATVKPLVALKRPLQHRAPWPALGFEASAVRRLIAAQARRDAKGHGVAGLSTTTLRALLLLRQRERRLRAGWPAIFRWLRARVRAEAKARRDLFMLVGTYHDAAGQLTAFRRLVGPLGLAAKPGRPPRVVLEQLDATGRWANVPRALQTGDDALLSRLRRGDLRALAALRARQRRLNYTAWKYRYLDEVLDLVLMTRGAGQLLLPCDMPRPLQKRVQGQLAETTMLRLRELHCWQALAPWLRRPATVAMLWGQDHVGPQGFQRFVPRRATVIALYLYGHRPGVAGLERPLARELALGDPLLIPLADRVEQEDGGRYRGYALLLPGPRLGARWDQRRDNLPYGGPPPTRAVTRRTLVVRSSRAGTLIVEGKRYPVRAEEALRTRLEGAGPFVFSSRAGQLLAGSLELLRDGGTLTLQLDPPRRAVDALLSWKPSDGGGHREGQSGRTQRVEGVSLGEDRRRRARSGARSALR